MRKTAQAKRLPNRIWKYLKQSRYKQKDAAMLMGYRTATNISRWMSGREYPSLTNAVGLARTLSTSVEALFPELARCWEDEINPRCVFQSKWPPVPI